MKKRIVFGYLLLVFTACSHQEVELRPETVVAGGMEGIGSVGESNGSYLVWLNSKSGETQKITEELQRVNRFDRMLSFQDLPGEHKSDTLVAMAADSLTDLTVVVNATDLIAGTYDVEMLREIRQKGKGVICIAYEDGEDALKSNLLRLFGVYIGKGFYRVSFPKEQVFDFYWKDDPDALRKLCGVRESLAMDTRAAGSGTPSETEITNKALHVMKKIRVSNRYFVYTNDYHYLKTGVIRLDPYTAQINRFKPRDDKKYDAFVDREWVLDAYNLRIYAPTNGDNLLAVYNDGGSGFINHPDDKYFSMDNPPMNTVQAVVWGLRNKAYSEVRVDVAGASALNLNLIDFAPGLPESETSITHSESRKVGFQLGFRPELSGDYSWGKSVTYQLAEMTRKVSRTVSDKQMDYRWEWYPETLFQGNKAMKDNGMIDGAAMISPVWYEVIYDNVASEPSSERVFCDYNNDLAFNQNLFTYQQDCAITAKTTGASAGVVAVELTDGMLLQVGGAWFNSWGTPAKHSWTDPNSGFRDLSVDVNQKTTVWIDYNNW